MGPRRGCRRDPNGIPSGAPPVFDRGGRKGPMWAVNLSRTHLGPENAWCTGPFRGPTWSRSYVPEGAQLGPKTDPRLLPIWAPHGPRRQKPAGSRRESRLGPFCNSVRDPSGPPIRPGPGWAPGLGTRLEPIQQECILNCANSSGLAPAWHMKQHSIEKIRVM